MRSGGGFGRARRLTATVIAVVLIVALAACEPSAPPGFTATPAPPTGATGATGSASRRPRARHRSPAAPHVTVDGTTVRIVGLGNGVSPDFDLPAGSAAMTVSVCASNQVIPFVTLVRRERDEARDHRRARIRDQESRRWEVPHRGRRATRPASGPSRSPRRSPRAGTGAGAAAVEVRPAAPGGGVRDEDHRDRAVRLRRRPARVRLPQGVDRRGHHGLGRDLRLAHVGVAGDRAAGHGPAAHRRGPAAHRAHERTDLVRRPPRRPGTPEGPRRHRPRAVGHQGEVARRARLRAARRPVPRPDPAVLVALRDLPGDLAARSSARSRRSPTRRGRAGARDVVDRGFKVLKTNLDPGGHRRRATDPADLPRRGDRPADDRRGGELDRDAARRRRAGHRHRRRRPVRLPDGRHRPARTRARAVRPLLARGRELRSRRAARGPRADDHPPVPRREPHPARAVPAVLPEARDGRGDDRDPVQRPVGVAPHRRDGRALRHDDLAAQLDEPARDADQRPPVRRRVRTSRSSRSTSTTCPGRATC